MGQRIDTVDIIAAKKSTKSGWLCLTKAALPEALQAVQAETVAPASVSTLCG